MQLITYRASALRAAYAPLLGFDVVMDPAVLRHTEAEPRSAEGPPGCIIYIAEGSDADRGRHLELRQGSATLGADPAAELVLNDPKVSRRHAEVSITERGILWRDLGSKNGSFVLDNRIDQAELQLGARVRVGQTVLLLLPIGDGRGIAPERDSAYGELRGSSAAMRRLFAVLKRLEPGTAPVLIEGETGTGKELVARAIHAQSSRKAGPFVVVDCGSLPKELIDAELFGHSKGAFTGAQGERVGLLEQAHQGTLFLDEIGELPLEQQPRLLRALESRQIRRVGENHYRDIDVRVLAASHRDLQGAVKAGRFREDLYYRLAVVLLRIPPLRERRDDVRVLAQAIAEQLGHAQSLPYDVLQAMTHHDWPGNVRELRNAVHRLLTLGELGEQISGPRPNLAAGSAGTGAAEEVDTSLPYKEARERVVEHFEAVYIKALLDKHQGHLEPAAAEAGIVKKYFKKLVEKHGLSGID